jgi:ribosomal-protein-serine acetyltransferase
VLRWWEPADAPALFEAVQADRPTLIPWIPWAPSEHRAPHETVYMIEKMKRDRTHPSGPFAMAILDRATGAVVGGTGLHALHPEAHEAEIGYWVRAGLRGRGLCTEAVAGLLTWAFTPQSRAGWGLRRAHIRCAAGNGPSAAVPRKLGLRPEARLVKDRWVPGFGWDDTLAWGVLSEEWDPDARCARPAVESGR